MSLKINITNIHQVEKVIEDLPKCINGSNGGLAISNYVLYELIIEILTKNVKIPSKFRYDEKRYIIEKALRKFITYKIKSTNYLRRSVIHSIKNFSKHSSEKSIFIFFISSQLEQRLEVHKNFTFFNKKLIATNWSYLLKNYDFEKYLQMPYKDLSKDAFQKFKPYYVNVVGSPYKFLIEDYSKPFELLRAIVNFSLQFGSFYMDPKLPLNKMPPSVTTLIFSEDGNYKTYYYPYAQYENHIHHFVNNSKLKLLRKLLKYFSCSNLNTEYKKFISEILIRYSNAFDSFDWDSIYLALWIILEKIAFPVGDSVIKEVPKRISKIANLDKYSTELMDGLKNIRNNLVHRGIFTGNESSPILFLKLIVERIIYQLICNQLHFHKISEIEYLHDLQSNPENLTKKLSFYKKYDDIIKKQA